MDIGCYIPNTATPIILFFFGIELFCLWTSASPPQILFSGPIKYVRMKGIHFHFIRKIHAPAVIISLTMIEDLINLAAALVKRAWFAYPLKDNDEEFTQEEEEKEMKDSIEARDVSISNESNAQLQGHNSEQKEQYQQTLTGWLYEKILPLWKAEAPSSLDTVQVDEYNWTKNNKDERGVIQSSRSDSKPIDHSSVIVDEYNWKASDDESPQRDVRNETKQKARNLDHSKVMYDEYNWTPSSTTALKDIKKNKPIDHSKVIYDEYNWTTLGDNKNNESEEGWPSVYDHGKSKK